MRRCWFGLVLVTLALGCGRDDPSRPAELDDPVTEDVPTVLVFPESVAVTLTNDVQFSASVENTSNQQVTWGLEGGPARGSISTEGLYTAPSTMPDPPRALVWARSDEDSTALDSAWVNLADLPSAAEIELLGEMYEANYEVVALAEQVTGIAGTALGMARFLGGDDTIRSGRLYEDASGWHFVSTEEPVLEVSPLDGPRTVIDYAVADGRSPAEDGVRAYCRGVQFIGELDCTIRIGSGDHSLRLTNSSRLDGVSDGFGQTPVGAAFERTMAGSIPDADGGVWTFDLDLRGELWGSALFVPYSEGMVQALSGTFTTPAGLSVAVEDSLSAIASNWDGHYYSAVAAGGFGGSFTAVRASDQYRWNELSYFWKWIYSGPLRFEDWHAAGTVYRNEFRIGRVGFDRPISPDMWTRARPVLAFGKGQGLYLEKPDFMFEDPSRPALSPFSTGRW